MSRCYYKTRTGSTMNVAKDNNQDNFIIKPNLLGIKGQYFFAVCDGHGEDGHFVSALIKSKLTSIIEKELSLKKNNNEETYNEVLITAIEQINEYVTLSEIKSDFSGSTLICTLIIGNIICCANIGDSRAVLGRKEKSWKAVNLSTDQKPSRSDEAQRIIETGGRVVSFEEGSPLRVWFKYDNSPGLAMTRSIGDKASKKIGVICTPEIMNLKIKNSDKFIILASDGLWDQISSDKAVEIVSKAWGKGKPEACCEKLIKKSVRKWQKTSDSIDDITIIVIFLRRKNKDSL